MINHSKRASGRGDGAAAESTKGQAARRPEHVQTAPTPVLVVSPALAQLHDGLNPIPG